MANAVFRSSSVPCYAPNISQVHNCPPTQLAAAAMECEQVSPPAQAAPLHPCPFHQRFEAVQVTCIHRGLTAGASGGAGADIAGGSPPPPDTPPDMRLEHCRLALKSDSLSSSCTGKSVSSFAASPACLAAGPIDVVLLGATPQPDFDALRCAVTHRLTAAAALLLRPPSPAALLPW